MRFFSLICLLFTTPSIKSEVLAINRDPQGSVHALQNPRCFANPSQIDQIKTLQKSNDKKIKASQGKAKLEMIQNPSIKYEGYTKLFANAGIPQDEILQRLIYAEVQASQCDKKENEALTQVTEVILNRVRRRKGDIPSVVFGYNQFASSLHFYKESAYKDFLCPTNEALWTKVIQKIQALQSGRQKPSLPKDTYHYYFFKHSPRFKPPQWTKKYKAGGTVGSKKNPCLVSYRNKNWK